MAITRMKRKDGTIYYGISYRFPRNRDGEQRRATAGTRDEAKKVEVKIINELLAGRDPRVALGETGNFEEHAKEVLAKHYATKRCFPWAKIVIETHLIPYFGKMPLANLTAKRIADYMQERIDQGMARSTVDGHRAVLSLALSKAVDWDLMSADANRIRKAPKLGEHKQNDRWLTPEEQRALIAAGDTNRLRHARDAAILSLGTGGRHSEVVGVRWEDVDLERGLVTYIAANTKNGKPRTISIVDRPAVLAMLRARHANRPERDRFCKSAHVFTYQGRPVKSVNGAFRSLVKAAGLGRDVVFHTLRHSFGTRFGHLGGDPRDLMDIGGWSDLKTVQRYYHPGADRTAQAMAMMDGDLTAPEAAAAPTK